jgi:hypothetical protein
MHTFELLGQPDVLQYGYVQLHGNQEAVRAVAMRCIPQIATFTDPFLIRRQNLAGPADWESGISGWSGRMGFVLPCEQ